MRGLFDNLWSIAAAWLLAFCLCLGGWASLDSPQAEQARVTRAGAAASAELAEAVATRAPELAALTRALLVRQDTGFAWLRVRDAEGYPLAAAGRLEPTGPAASGWFAIRLRRFAYAAISSEHRLTIDHDGRAVGSIEFGLMSGAGSAPVLGALALLLGLPLLLFFTLGLGRAFAREWRAGERIVTTAAATAAPQARIRGPAPTVPAVIPRPAPSAAALELLAGFDRSVVLVGRDRCIEDLNAPAERLIGRSREQLRGQRLADALPLFLADLKHPVVLPLDDCLAGRMDEFRRSYFLRVGDMPVREIECTLGPLRDASGAISGALLSLAELGRQPAGAAAAPADAPSSSRMLLDQVLENVITTDSQDRIHFANARALENLGYALTEIRGQHISRLLPEPFLQQPEARVADYAGQGLTQSATVRRRDSSEFAATMTVQPVTHQGREGHVITIRRKVAALGDARIGPRLRQLLAATEGELIAVDTETLAVVVANTHACDALGYKPEDLAHTTLSRLIPKLEGAVLRDCLGRLWRDPETQVEADAIQLTASGTERPVRLRMSLWRKEGDPLLLVSAQPSARGRYPAARRGEETADFLAEHDPATGLPNRKLFVRRLEAAVAAQQSFAVAQLAITGVVEVAAGHPQDTVDLLLRAIADRLCAVVGATDTVARIGTDEFALLLRGPGLGQEGQSMLGRHLAIFARPFRAGVLEFQIAATAGVTAFPEDHGDAETLLRHAASALQLARPQEIAVYDERARPERRSGDGLSQLREAHADGEANIELQPLMDTRARLIAGAEVLLSWRQAGQKRLHSSSELRQAGVSPALIEALPAWLFEQACEQHARWRDLELPALPLLVNASAVTLTRRDLHQLRGMLARFHVPPQHLLLMVNGAELESLLLKSDGWLPLARDMGLRLGVDDVANTRSDLLRRIDADLVRLARSTTAGLPAARQASDQAGVGIIAGQRIGALVLAEGVERNEQREALINLGCYLQQGRLLGDPMAPRDFSRLLTRAEVGAF